MIINWETKHSTMMGWSENNSCCYL